MTSSPVDTVLFTDSLHSINRGHERKKVKTKIPRVKYCRSFNLGQELKTCMY
ncbi:hypothetical protein JHK82_019507 [Glycine max]|nr:hypothetical protein JHK82_019507 [Glycine max]